MSPRCSSGRLAASLLIALLAASACTRAPTVGQERGLGAQLDLDLKRQMRFVNDRVVVDYLERMGGEILHAAGPQPYDYRFQVVDDEEINAFAGPGGYVYVHTETILKARNASELAGVLAHEVGHVVQRHVADNYVRQRNTSFLYTLLVQAASIFGGGAGWAAASFGGSIATSAMLNSFSRDDELEADDFAVRVLPAAGYDPEGLVTFFRTIQAEGGPRPPAFLSSHPTTGDRIEEAQSKIEALGDRRGLRVNDGGRFEIIQARIRLLTRRGDAPTR